MISKYYTVNLSWYDWLLVSHVFFRNLINVGETLNSIEDFSILMYISRCDNKNPIKSLWEHHHRCHQHIITRQLNKNFYITLISLHHDHTRPYNLSHFNTSFNHLNHNTQLLCSAHSQEETKNQTSIQKVF